MSILTVWLYYNRMAEQTLHQETIKHIDKLQKKRKQTQTYLTDQIDQVINSIDAFQQHIHSPSDELTQHQFD